MWRTGTTRTRANIAATIRKRVTMKISVLRMARLGHCCKHGSIIPRPGRVRSRNDMGGLIGNQRARSRVENPIGSKFEFFAVPISSNQEQTRVHMVLTSRGMVRRTMSSNRGQIEFYRANAAQCIAVAQRTSDTSSKLALLEMARAWLLLAEQGEKNGETTLVYETPHPSLRDQADPV
jgi:hypothetical protein